MSINKTQFVAQVNEVVTTLGAADAIDCRSAAVAGQKFLNALASIDPIEFNNEPEEPALAEFTEVEVEGEVLRSEEVVEEGTLVETLIGAEDGATQQKEN